MSADDDTPAPDDETTVRMRLALVRLAIETMRHTSEVLAAFEDLPASPVARRIEGGALRGYEAASLYLARTFRSAAPSRRPAP